MRFTLALLLALALVVVAVVVGAGCAPPPLPAPSLRDLGVIPNPPFSGGRDGGYSIRFGGHSVWTFGDTFFSQPAADGYQWRASTWSYSDDDDASDGLQGWTHALGSDGKPLQLLPHTAAEQTFDDAHNGTPCPAASDCGARHTLWPGAAVVDPATNTALIFYSKEDTEPTGSFAFTGEGNSIATWAAPDAPASRVPVAGSSSDDSVLFAAAEPPFGAAALLDGGLLYAYACAGGGLSSPCIIGRVPPAGALDRSQWRFFDGKQWVADVKSAHSICDGAPIMSVHFNPYLQKFIAFYMGPLCSDFTLRTAPRPEGPWSNAQLFGQGAPAADGSWDYALLAHPELERDGGQREYLSYFQPGNFLNGTVHLLELTYR